MKLIYIADVIEVVTGKNISVIESQVFELLNYLSDTKKFSEIILLAGIKPNQPGIETIRRKVRDNIKTIRFNCYPQYPIIC